MSIDSNIFNCPVLTEELLREYYPISTMEELEEYIDFSEDIIKLVVLASMKTNLRGEKYIEVLFVDKEYSIYRVVIQKGYVMNEKDENIFKDNLNLRIKIDFYMFAKLQNDVNKYYSDIQLRHYYKDEIAPYLMRLYYTTHRGPREILYKANLDNIAEELDYVEDYNIVGSTPEKILGLPLNLIKIINNNKDIGKIIYHESREEIRTLYYKYSDYFGRKNLPNKYQFLYLEEHEEITGTFDKSVFWSLSKCYFNTMYCCFKECCDLVKRLGKRSPYKKMIYTEGIFEAKDILECIMKLEGILSDDEFVKPKMTEERYIYEEPFGEVVIVPKTFMEIVAEAINLKNELYKNFEQIIYSNIHILFFRKKDNPSKSYITIFIHKNKVISARKKNDMDPSWDDLIFIKGFANYYNIHCDMDSLTSANLEDEIPFA